MRYHLATLNCRLLFINVFKLPYKDTENRVPDFRHFAILPVHSSHGLLCSVDPGEI